MSFQKFKSDSYCVGGRHRSAANNIYGDIASKGSKVLISYCPICNRRKSMTVSENTIQAKELCSFFKNLGRISAEAGEKLATNVVKIPLGLWILQETLLPQLRLEILTMSCQHYLEYLLFIVLVKVHISKIGVIFCHINRTKNRSNILLCITRKS